MIQYSIYNEWSLKSFEVRVDSVRETSETIASECDVTFELYRKQTHPGCKKRQGQSEAASQTGATKTLIS